MQLTREGRAGLKRISEPFATINARLERALDEEALTRFAAALDSIRAALDET